MAALIGKEGGTDCMILLSKPFYLTVRTPIIGKRGWHVRLRIYHNRMPRLHLYRSPKCRCCGEVIKETWREECSQGHSAYGQWLGHNKSQYAFACEMVSELQSRVSELEKMSGYTYYEGKGLRRD